MIFGTFIDKIEMLKRSLPFKSLGWRRVRKLILETLGSSLVEWMEKSVWLFEIRKRCHTQSLLLDMVLVGELYLLAYQKI